MPLVRIAITNSHTGNGDYDETRTWIAGSVTSWEEVSREDLDFLTKYRWQLKQQLFPHNHYQKDLLIIELDDEPVEKRIANLKELLAVELKKEEEAKKKRAVDDLRRKAERERQKAAQEKKTLLALAKKHGLTLPPDIGEVSNS